MLESLRTFFDDSRHTLSVRNVDARLDVLAFEGTEGLSQPFSYAVKFTCPDADIDAGKVLGEDASFSLHGPPPESLLPGLGVPEIKPLRTLHGVITSFKRLSGSANQARYEITLQPRLALLARGREFRIYQHQSVPEIVESVLRSRHDFRGQDFIFTLSRLYPKRARIMQYGESDLAFISRLLADVGIWYRFSVDEHLKIEVVEFHDDQHHYPLDVEQPHRPQSRLASSGRDSVWRSQSSHQVVEQRINIQANDHRAANGSLKADVDHTCGATTAYAAACHSTEAYTAQGGPHAYGEDLQGESGFFYARLRHERYLNDQTRLSGVSSSATLVPGQVVRIGAGAPRVFGTRAVITQLSVRAARDRRYDVRFEAIPYSETVCFRPALQAKPKITGTVRARVTSTSKKDPYGHIDIQGRYRVSFLCDGDSWKPGEESLWLRLACPYASDTHGLHLPLSPGTEVAIAFDQGDPDRPYIAHALHDRQHVDHTLRDCKRDVLLDMEAAIKQLERALALARSMAQATRGAQAKPGDGAS